MEVAFNQIVNYAKEIDKKMKKCDPKGRQGHGPGLQTQTEKFSLSNQRTRSPDKNLLSFVLWPCG